MNYFTAISEGFWRDFKKTFFAEQPSMAASECVFTLNMVCFVGLLIARLIACSHFVRPNLSKVGTLCQTFTSLIFFLLDELPQFIAPQVTILRPTKLSTD